MGDRPWQTERVRERIKTYAKRAAVRCGYVIRRRDHEHSARRVAAMRTREVDLVIDVGANRGQYVTWLRDAGYEGNIVSLEPIPDVFSVLQRNHGHDRRWRGFQLAAGATAGQGALHVVKDSDVLSSMLVPAHGLTQALPFATRSSVIDVAIVALDDIWSEIVPDDATVMLKIDTQGFEHSVLDGVKDNLWRVALLEVEMSLLPLYEEGSTVLDMLPRLATSGFDIISIESGFVQVETGQVLDIDVLAGRRIA